MYDQPFKLSVFLYIRIDDSGKHVKISGAQGGCRFNNQDALVFQELVFYHDELSLFNGCGH